MNDNDIINNPGVLTDSDVFVADETTVTEGETETFEGDEGESESTTDSSTVVEDSSAECFFNDVNICNKLDIIIMLLIVIIAIKMFSPLANTHKRVVQKKEK